MRLFECISTDRALRWQGAAFTSSDQAASQPHRATTKAEVLLEFRSSQVRRAGERQDGRWKLDKWVPGADLGSP